MANSPSIESDRPAATSRRGDVKARLHDSLVNLASHPLAWPLIQVARRIARVFTVPGLGVVINDAQVANEILRRDKDFTKNGPGSISGIVTEILGPSALINMDGAAHSSLRSKLVDILSPANCDALMGACDEPLSRLARDLVAHQNLDLVQFMRQLSSRLTFDMLGIPPPIREEAAAYEEFFALGTRISRALRLTRPTASALSAVRSDCDRLGEYARAGYEAADSPQHSLVHRLRTLGLSFEEAKSIISVFFLTGTLTTAAALPRIVALLIDSGQFARLRQDVSAIPQAIEEGLRYTTPAPATVRIAQRRMELRGHIIPEGSRLLILTCNLARDSELFPKPDRFDIARTGDGRAKHLWFGAGPHFCLGFALAQRELHAVLNTLVALPQELRIVSRRPTFGALTPGYARLVVALGA